MARTRLAILGLMLGPAALGAQSIIVEAVESQSGLPVGVVSVALLDDRGKFVLPAVATDTMSRVTLEAPGPGRYRTLVRRLGFRSDTSPIFRVSETQTVVRGVRLKAIPYELDRVDVTRNVNTPGNFEARAFEARKRSVSVGRLFTARDLDSLSINNLSEAVNLVPMAFVTEAAMPGDKPGQLTRWRWAGSLPCQRVAYYWNNLRMTDDMALSFLMTIDRKVVTALEVYSTPNSIPIEFSSGEPCAAIVVWTKQGIVRK